MGKHVSRWQHYLAALIGTTGYATAYPVYQNTAAQLPIATAFFWFTTFALAASFAYPRDIRSGIPRGLTITERWHHLYPTAPWMDWIASLRRGGWTLLSLTIVSYTCNFVLLLSALRSRQSAVVVTVLVIQQLRPLLITGSAYWFLRDTCRNWRAYVVGTAITIVGVLLYKGTRLTDDDTIIDGVVTLTILSVLCECVLRTARTMYRRRHGVDALDAMRSTQLAATIIGCGWMCWDGIVVPSPAEFAGLAFLGIIPTAVSGILVNRAQDVIGVPATESVSTLRPLLLLPLAWVPIHAIQTKQIELLGPTHYAGIALSIAGLCIVFLIAQPVPVEREDASRPS